MWLFWICGANGTFHLGEVSPGSRFTRRTKRHAASPGNFYSVLRRCALIPQTLDARETGGSLCGLYQQIRWFTPAGPLLHARLTTCAHESATSSAATTTRRRTANSGHGETGLTGLQHRERSHIDDTARGHTWHHHMHRLRHAQQQGPDRQPVGGGLQQGEGDIGGIQGRHHQQIGRAGEAAVGHRAARIDSLRAASACISPSISKSGARARISASALRILRAVRIAGAEAGMRQQRRLGREAEAAHRLGRQQGHLGDLLGGGIDNHVGVAEEQRAVGQDQAPTGNRAG